jgi:hypothetical protein
MMTIMRRLLALGSPVGPEAEQVGIIIRGLPQQYKYIRASFFSHTSIVWSIDDIKTAVREADQEQDDDSGLSTSQDGAFLSSQDATFMSTAQDGVFFSSAGRHVCLRCKIPGHKAEDCRAAAPRPSKLNRSADGHSTGSQHQQQRYVSFKEQSVEERIVTQEQKLADLYRLRKQDCDTPRAGALLADDIDSRPFVTLTDSEELSESTGYECELEDPGAY